MASSLGKLLSQVIRPVLCAVLAVCVCLNIYPWAVLQAQRLPLSDMSLGLLALGIALLIFSASCYRDQRQDARRRQYLTGQPVNERACDAVLWSLIFGGWLIFCVCLFSMLP